MNQHDGPPFDWDADGSGNSAVRGFWISSRFYKRLRGARDDFVASTTVTSLDAPIFRQADQRAKSRT
jgi:hypothetical protein